MKLIDISLNGAKPLTEEVADRMEKTVSNLLEVFYVPDRDAYRITSVSVALKHDTVVPGSSCNLSSIPAGEHALNYNKLKPELVRKMDAVADGEESDDVKLDKIFQLFDEAHRDGPIFMFDNVLPLRASDLLAVAKQCISQTRAHDEMTLNQFSGSYNGVSMGNGNFVYLYDYEGRLVDSEKDLKTANSFWERFCKDQGSSEHKDVILHVQYGLGGNPVRSEDKFQHYVAALNRTVDTVFIPVIKK